MVVVIMQNKTKARLKSDLMSAVAMSLNSSTGSATLNTYLSATLLNSLVNRPIRIRNQPRTIMRNIGNVAFKLKIKSAMIILISLNLIR